MTLNDWTQKLLAESANSDCTSTLQAALKDLPNNSFFASDTVQRFADLLQQVTKIPGFSIHLTEFLPILFSSGVPETAFAQLHHFSDAYFSQTDKSFCWDRTHTQSLLLIFGRSDFLSRRLIRYPLLADDLLESPFLLQKKDLSTMESELQQQLDQSQNNSNYNIEEFKNDLRRFKYKEYLRVTIRDLAQLAPLAETLEEISSIAVSTMRMALTGTANFLIHKYNPEKPPITTEVEPFMILGMGKLGGNELNYSSDVDLIFIHDYESLTGDSDKDHKLRMKIARSFIEVMSDVTEEGFVARVDMRLRPGGERAPLVQSLDEVELYYSASGEIWERQALIKAKPVAGTKQTGVDFINMITPFVYRRLLDEGLLQDVEKVKSRIEKEHLRENHLNVKLGVGGIREIEFFVQTFQLLYAGGKTELRSPSTLFALDQLRKTQLIPERDAQTLEQAYLFLRRVEHCLQLREERQTHTLSNEINIQQEVARILAYHDLDIEKARQRMLGDLKDVMGGVRSIFSGLFSRKHIEIEAAIRNSARIQHFNVEEQQFIESFSQQLAASDTFGSDTKIKNKFQRLFESVSHRLTYYQKLSKSPSSLSRLMRIAETSEMLWNYLLNHLDLLDQLESSTLSISAEQWTKQLEEKIISCKGDEEEEIDQLRQFKHTITFLIGSAELEGVFSYEQARLGLSLLAEVITQAAFKLARKWLLPRYGEVRNQECEPGQFAILGLGKLGGRELTYHSDLDLIFIHSGAGISSGPREIGAQEYWVKLIQRMISVLTTITRTGFAYKLDTRLRPSGNSGVLVTPLKMYLKYHESSKAWEHQALIKGRIIGGCGSQEWFEKVKIGMINAVYEWIPPNDMNAQIDHLRKRKEEELSGENKSEHHGRRNLKEGHGGLLDVEFLTQAMQLQYGQKYHELRVPKTLDALSKMSDLELINRNDAATLQKNYKLLRLIENGLRLLYDESTDMLDFSNIQEVTILRLLKHQGYDVANLKALVEQATQEIRNIYLNYFQKS